MRMLSDSSLTGGVVDQRSSAAPATAPPLDTPLSAWTVAASQGQLTPDGRMITTTGFSSAHMGLILVALLCALAGALSLISLLRCALHYCGRGSRALDVASPSEAGLKMSALRRIPVAVYETEAPGAPEGAECAICLGEFADGEAVRLLPRCRHGFHVHCIDMWLSAHSSCPICRDSLLDEGAAAVPTAVAGEGTVEPSVYIYPGYLNR